MKIGGINSYMQAIEPVIKQDQIAPKAGEGVEQGAKSPNFGEMLKGALKEVDELQNQAETQIQGVALSKDGFTTHGAMIALEKADIAFQLMSTIRSKIIRAYEEVIRTQI